MDLPRYVWATDEEMVYRRMESDRAPKAQPSPTGAGDPRLLSSVPIQYERAWWFPDGKRILVDGSEPGHRARLYVRDLNGANSSPLPLKRSRQPRDSGFFPLTGSGSPSLRSDKRPASIQ